MHFKTITFDGDDTLWDFNKMMLRGSQAVAVAIQEKLGTQYAYMDVDFLTKVQREQIARSDPQTVDYVEVRRVGFGRMLKKAKVPNPAALAEELLEIYLAARNERYEIYEDAHSTLAALRGRFVVGYITNGTTRPESIGLEPYFDFVITPETLNMRKPRPEIFHHAAQLAGQPIDTMLHVGDNLESDVAGALNAGGQAVWYNPHQNPNTSRVQPTAEINRLGTLLDLLGR